MSDFQQHRLERVMDPKRRNTLEANGVLIPASVCGPSGEHYPSPRLDAEGNYSHITCVGPLGRYVLMSTACAKNRLRIAGSDGRLIDALCVLGAASSNTWKG